MVPSNTKGKSIYSLVNRELFTNLNLMFLQFTDHLKSYGITFDETCGI